MVSKYFPAEEDGVQPMLNTAETSPRKFVARQSASSLILLLVLILGMCTLLPLAGFAAPDSPGAEGLKQQSQSAFLKGDYARAAALDLEIAEKFPGSPERRYAVQMLGTMYEDNIVDVKKAIQWNREFLEKYADARQVPFYRDKLATLQKLLDQEQAYKTYQAIRFANLSDEAMIAKFEALLKEHPGFLLKDKVESELGYAYGRLDERKKSAQAFESIASAGPGKLSASDGAAYQTADRYWQMRSNWAAVAWTVIGALWAVVLWMKPWRQISWASAKKFLLWPALWLVIAGAGMPLFYSIETTGYPIVIPGVTVYIAIALNFIVLLWLVLLMHAKLWRSRPRTLRWLSPVLALLMTTSVFYLWVVYQPNGPFIVDVCVVKYNYWKQELGEWKSRIHPQKQTADGQNKRPVQLPEDPSLEDK